MCTIHKQYKYSIHYSNKKRHTKEKIRHYIQDNHINHVTTRIHKK
jgi:hypothetical protein